MATEQQKPPPAEPQNERPTWADRAAHQWDEQPYEWGSDRNAEPAHKED